MPGQVGIISHLSAVNCIKTFFEIATTKPAINLDIFFAGEMAEANDSSDDSSAYEMPEDRILSPCKKPWSIEDRAHDLQCLICKKNPALEDVLSLDYSRKFHDFLLTGTGEYWIICSFCKLPYHYLCIMELIKQRRGKRTRKTPTFTCKFCGGTFNVHNISEPIKAAVPLAQYK